jgi:phytoene synthase
MRESKANVGTAMPNVDWAESDAIAREHGRTFYFASRCLPLAQRQASRAAYAFCRTADDLVDATPETGAQRALDELARWEAQIETPRDPIARAFARARELYEIPVEPVHDLFRGLRMDLTVARYATWQDLRTYCYRVAGTVGLIVAPILGCRDPEALSYAAELGIAMQLTNILRDVGEDARLGRIYLPLDEIARFGGDPAAIIAGTPAGNFRDLMDFEIERARHMYTLARRGIPFLAPFGRVTTLVASNLYEQILDEIVALDYDVFRQRAHVSSRRKLLSLPGILTAFVTMPRVNATIPSLEPVHVPGYHARRQLSIRQPISVKQENGQFGQ